VRISSSLLIFFFYRTGYGTPRCLFTGIRKGPWYPKPGMIVQDDC